MGFAGLSLRIRFIGILAPSAGLIFFACANEYDDCRASKTCAPEAAAAASGIGSGGTAGATASESAGEPGQGGDAARGGQGGTLGNLAAAGQGGEAGTSSGAAGEGGVPSGGTGATGGNGAGGEAGRDAEPLPDTTPPYVVEISPADGATGVRADADIVVTFSEPMHRVETEKAYGSLDLPTKNVTFLWSNGDRTLTIHPDKGLEYGHFTEADAVPFDQTYAYILASEGRDVAGNRLEDDFEASFTMLRRYSEALPSRDTTAIIRSEDGYDGTSAACGEEVTRALIGEVKSNPKSGRKGHGLLVAFEGKRLTRTSPEDLLSAELTFVIPVEALELGPLRVDRVQSGKNATWDMPTLEELTLAAAGATRAADALAGVREELLSSPEEQIQYFIHYELPLNGDDTTQTAEIACADTRLHVTYLAY
jgi:hypothetical protein